MINFKSKISHLDLSWDNPLEGGGQTKKKNFIKKEEDFVCGNCGEKVKGDGYTDHCPKCLWGKHVDRKIPGDRESECRGLMKPIEVVYLSGKFKIHYKCTRCRHEFWVRAAEAKVGVSQGDNRDLLIELMKK